MSADDGAVRLSFPPSTSNLRLLRLVTASVATDAQADVDVVDDIRVAADELAAALIAAAPASPQPVEIAVRVAEAVLTISGQRAVEVEAAPVLDPIAAALLDVTLDDYAFEATGEAVRFSLRKRLDEPVEP